jgi:glycosyltransferase involved in cell wall biosynthesis
MPLFAIPGWLEPHLYSGRNFKDLTPSEILNLQERLSKFNAEAPDVSIVIPAWNEENNIFKTLSSLASNTTQKKVEIIVINNNSTDGTQHVLDTLNVKSFYQKEQGISHARQLGLLKAAGKYHLCADSDTYYPPSWIDVMVSPLKDGNGYIGVYGRYSFIPTGGQSRFLLSVYEAITGLLINLRKYKREHLNVLGFNMGFITEFGLSNGGFDVNQVRQFDNVKGTNEFVDESEDGRMALNLKKTGKLYLAKSNEARVYTSSRRIVAEGGLFQAFRSRFLLHFKNMGEYLKGAEVN